MGPLVVRHEVLEFGSSPVSPWLNQVESLSAIRAILEELLRSGNIDDKGRSFVTPQAVGAVLDITPVQTKVLLDLLAAVVEPADLVQRSESGDEVVGVEAHSLALALAAHHYLREAHKADAGDVWPADGGAWQAEPSSPMRMAAASWSRDQQAGHSAKAYLPATRQHLQQHLQHHEALLAGFGAWLARHAAPLLALATAPAAAPPASGPHHPQGMVSAADLDRLAMLLRPQTPEEAEAAADAHAAPSSGGAGSGSSGRKRRMAEGGSPMDVCPTPFKDVRVSEHTPFFAADDAAAYAPADAVATWLAEALRPADDTSDLMVTSGGGGSPHAPSPPRQSVFNQLAAQLGVLGPQGGPGDIQGLHRVTLARGEDDFPSGHARVLDCHDAVLYCLAPVQYALIAACTDCVVVVGAVGRALRVERCERVQIICAARGVCVNTCHDCILYLGANAPPLLLGDNRFLQLAPYNSGYERLAAHMAAAGVRPAPNHWDQPLALLPDHRQQAGAAAGEAASAPASPMQQWQAAATAREQAAESAAPSSPRGSQLHEAEGEAMELSQQASGVGAGLGGDGAVAVSPGAGGHLGEEGLPASPVAGAPPAVTVLPPGKLTPFVVPFKGGCGPLCGGPASLSLGIRAPPDSLTSFMAVGEGASGNFPPSPFVLPPAYAAAWQHKMQGAAEVRAAVKAAELEEGKKKELMAAIQAHFKDWLQATSAMRQVLDLARAERDEAG